MADTEEETKLRRCLEASSAVVRDTRNRAKPQGQLDENVPLTITASDVNIHSFTLNAAEEALMSDFKNNLESVINDHLPSLSTGCRKYLLDFLYPYNYDYETREFTKPFNIGILDSFALDLQGILDSINAFRAAWSGDQPKVQEFIKKYPNLKDRSGLWGITLLYSAARNKHSNLVNYLITKAGCSVNAQNQQHILRALSAPTITDNDYEVNPTAGSTALHGACFHGHLDVVKYLMEKGADCYMTNHADETPIMNANRWPEVLQFFRDYLIIGYSPASTALPNTPILEENESRGIDCVWEYKPMADQKWFPFSDAESSDLQSSLILKPNQEFKREIHLKIRSGIYSVSMMNFLRSGKDLDATQKLAWVRCRGSSILNFDCYALWQIMFTTHPEATSDSTLDILNIPTIYDSTFKVHLNSWYYVDARTNNQLDKTMKYRRKFVVLDLPFAINDQLRFDLQTFSFISKEKTASGFIRWIPKMVSNNPRHKDKIISVDQYSTLSNMDPVPLTTSRLKQVSELTDNSLGGDEEELGGNIDDDGSSFESLASGNNDDMINASDKVFIFFFRSYS
jgi:hypothetical protein